MNYDYNTLNKFDLTMHLSFRPDFIMLLAALRLSGLLLVLLVYDQIIIFQLHCHTFLFVWGMYTNQRWIAGCAVSCRMNIFFESLTRYMWVIALWFSQRLQLLWWLNVFDFITIWDGLLLYYKMYINYEKFTFIFT